jgi:hypothetical protein
MLPDGSDLQRLLEANMIFNIAGEWIYFQYNHYISRMRLDGSDIQALGGALSGERAEDIQISGDRIYFRGVSRNLSGIYSVNLEGGDRRTHLEGGGDVFAGWEKFIVHDGRIYFVNRHYVLYSVRLDGSDLRILHEFDPDCTLILAGITGEWLFYMYAEIASPWAHLHRMRLDGSNMHRIDE